MSDTWLVIAAAGSTAWGQSFGRFHVVVVHFPIALLIVAAAVELWAIVRRKGVSPTAAVCAVMGTLGAIVAAASGWYHRTDGSFTGSTFTAHEILAFISAGMAVVTIGFLIAVKWSTRNTGRLRAGDRSQGQDASVTAQRSKSQRWYRLSVMASALLVAVAGHFGGALTHGDGYLTAALFPREMEPVKSTGLVKAIAFPADGKVEFARDVRPIFEQSCYECHSAAKRRGGLRVDSKRMFFEGGNSGKEVAVGKSAESQLVERVIGKGDRKRMPLEHPPLPAEQIKILAAWVDQGANWPDALTNDSATQEKHWAYVKPVRAKLPEVSDKQWARNAIDYFVLARLEKEGLKPSAEADRVTLIRRLSLDLVGLPPTPEEVDSFVNDPRPDAYERLANRLLSSPHYGERWGRHWMDIARYADTNGYEKDNTRVIWPYRDWVISAINEDLPYDQFVIQQMAGDMLPGATAEQKIATGFHRNTMFNEEGGIDVEEFRFKAIVDRVQTTSTAFLGLTMHCAQCHNHKYDAISQREYYQLFSLLNNADEPEFKIPSRDVDAKRKEIEGQIAKVESEYEKNFPYYEVKTQWAVLKPTTQKSAGGAKMKLLADDSILASGKHAEKETYTIEASADTTGMTELRLEVLADDSLPKTGPGRAPNGNFVLSEIKVATTQPTTKPFAIASAQADYSQADFLVGGAIDGKPETGWAIAEAGGGVSVHARTARFAFKEKLPDGVTKLQITLEQQHPKHALGHFRLSLGKQAAPPASTQPIEVQRANYLAAKFAEWQKEVTAKCAHWTVAEPVRFTRANNATITKLGDNSLLFTGDNFYREDYKLDYRAQVKEVTGIRLDLLPHADLPNNGPGRNPGGGGLITEFSATTRPVEAVKSDDAALDRMTITNESATTRPTLAFDAPSSDAAPEAIAKAVDGKRDSHWNFGGGGAAHEAVFPLKEKLKLDEKTLLSLSILQNYFQSENLGRVRVLVTGDAKPAASGLPAAIEEILVKRRDQGSLRGKTPLPSPLPEYGERELLRYFLSITPLLAGEHEKVNALRGQKPGYQTTLVMQERVSGRTTRVHHRGEYMQERDPVTPGVPAILPQLSDDGPKDRLALARWLVDPENPLIGRVTMNRVWATYFGRGIVNTVDDFGIMGERPSHPELLDWMATELVRQHWSMKAMHKLIVTSATYRQSSRVTPELEKRDPVNVLLARGPRLRVEAEVVRDIALSAAGLLSPKIGGPSVFPPQPEGVEQLSYGPLKWVESGGEDRYRRGMYTFAKRTSLYPGLTTFDAPTAELTCTRRVRSNTPLQALTTMNDGVFVEAARSMAQRLMREGPSDVDGKIREAFRLCVARAPEAKELNQIKSFYEGQLERFKGKKADPALVALSDPKTPPKDANVPELAAWTTVARSIMNLDETITRE